jgi:hypothetical protein
VIRKYWFEIFHFALWILVAALLFFQQLAGLPFALFAIVLCAVAFAINALHGQTKAALLILAAPLLAVMVVLPLQTSGALNWVEFNLVKGIFQARVDALPVSREPRLIAFRMDDRGWQAIGPRLFEARTYVNGDYVLERLVYDESGEIARPPEQRSAAWKMRAQGRPHFHSMLQPVSQSHSVEVTAMGGNWFWVEQILQYPGTSSADE